MPGTASRDQASPATKNKAPHQVRGSELLKSVCEPAAMPEISVHPFRPSFTTVINTVFAGFFYGGDMSVPGSSPAPLRTRGETTRFHGHYLPSAATIFKPVIHNLGVGLRCRVGCGSFATH